MFLNKPKFIESLFKIFEEAEKELVLIVPYIKMSTDVFNALKDCDTRDVETLIVCRKDCLHPKELQKLRQLKNLTLLAHPNLHSKIYLNQNDIIIGSMNLYEYSQKFNREAGVLLSNINPKGNTSNILDFSDGDPSEDCRVELQNIISSSEEIFVSKKAAEYGVDFTILKTLDELQYDKAKTLSKYFTTKKFQLLETKEGLLHVKIFLIALMSPFLTV